METQYNRLQSRITECESNYIGQDESEENEITRLELELAREEMQAWSEINQETYDILNDLLNMNLIGYGHRDTNRLIWRGRNYPSVLIKDTHLYKYLKSVRHKQSDYISFNIGNTKYWCLT